MPNPGTDDLFASGITADVEKPPSDWLKRGLRDTEPVPARYMNWVLSHSTGAGFLFDTPISGAGYGVTFGLDSESGILRYDVTDGATAGNYFRFLPTGQIDFSGIWGINAPDSGATFEAVTAEVHAFPGTSGRIFSYRINITQPDLANGKADYSPQDSFLGARYNPICAFYDVAGSGLRRQYLFELNGGGPTWDNAEVMYYLNDKMGTPEARRSGAAADDGFEAPVARFWKAYVRVTEKNLYAGSLDLIFQIVKVPRYPSLILADYNVIAEASSSGVNASVSDTTAEVLFTWESNSLTEADPTDDVFDPAFDYYLRIVTPNRGDTVAGPGLAETGAGITKFFSDIVIEMYHNQASG